MKRFWPAILTLAALLLLGCATTKGAVKQEQLPPDWEKQVPPPQQEEVTEVGGTLAEWQEALNKATGPESAESTTAAECKSLMDRKIAECQPRKGWSVDNSMVIMDLRSGKRYEFQDVKENNCPDLTYEEQEKMKKESMHLDRAAIDTQTDSTAASYSITCTVSCNWWECKKKANLTGTWVGEYTDLWGSKYCQFKETGTETFEIKMDDETSFSGKMRYDGQSSVVGGEHCEGGPASGEGRLSGSVSEDKVLGTMVSSSSFPFTATLSDDTLTGSYSYTFTEAGTAHSGKGEFKLTKKK